MWDGRGATPRPWKAKWSSGVAGVFWVYYNNVFKDPLDIITITTFTTEEHCILRINYFFDVEPETRGYILGNIPAGRTEE